MSCCMRDAVTLEALGIPTAIIVNDVFAPIAHATSALLRLPDDYVAKNVVWLPHPTSNLTDARAAALIDDRIDTIRDVLLGRSRAVAIAPPAPREGRARSRIARSGTGDRARACGEPPRRRRRPHSLTFRKWHARRRTAHRRTHVR